MKYKELELNNDILNKYDYKGLKHVRVNENSKGIILIDDEFEEVVGFIMTEKQDSGIMITALEVNNKYQKQGIGTYLFRKGIGKLKANILTVRKTNNKAINLYKKFGWGITKETDYQYTMRPKSYIKESEEIVLSEEWREDHYIPKQYRPSKCNYDKLYFVSNTSMDEVILEPRVPKNFLTEKGYEDNSTCRVCVAPSISDCLVAMSCNLKDKVLCVHIVNNIDKVKQLKPTIHQVPDCKITHEVWITNNVELKYIGDIKVTESYGDGMKYKYGENNQYEAELYKWEYEWVKKFNESLVESSIINEANIMEIREFFSPNIPDPTSAFKKAKKTNKKSDWETTLRSMEVFQKELHRKHTKDGREWAYKYMQNMIKKCDINYELTGPELEKMQNDFAILMNIVRSKINSKDVINEEMCMSEVLGKCQHCGSEVWLDDDWNRTGICWCGNIYDTSKIDPNSLKDSDYGLPSQKLYPMLNPKHVIQVISEGFSKCKDEFKQELADNIKKKILEFNMYNIPTYFSGLDKYISLDGDLKYNKDVAIGCCVREQTGYIIESGLEYEEIIESTLSTEERNKLKDEDFGLPKDRKYPLHDKEHVLLAIKYFNMCSKHKRAELARNIRNKVMEYNMKVDITHSKLRNYVDWDEDDSQWFIVKEEYDLSTKDGIIKAVNSFNSCNDKDMNELCDNICKASMELGVKLKISKDNLMRKYLDRVEPDYKYNIILENNEIDLDNIQDGFYTPDEIADQITNLDDDEILHGNVTIKEWFDYYRRRCNNEVSYNTQLESAWYNRLKNETDNDIITVLAWNPVLEFTSHNRKIASERLIETLNEEKKMKFINEEVSKLSVDDNGNIIYNKNIDFQQEFNKAHKLLLLYDETDNLESMKYELCKLWFINTKLEQKIDKLKREDRKELVDIRARILNDFNKYIKIVNYNDKSFNFSEYIKTTEYDPDKLVFSKNILNKGLDLVKRIMKK